MFYEPRNRSRISGCPIFTDGNWSCCTNKASWLYSLIRVWSIPNKLRWLRKARSRSSWKSVTSSHEMNGLECLRPKKFRNASEFLLAGGSGWLREAIHSAQVHPIRLFGFTQIPWKFIRETQTNLLRQLSLLRLEYHSFMILREERCPNQTSERTAHFFVNHLTHSQERERERGGGECIFNRNEVMNAGISQRMTHTWLLVNEWMKDFSSSFECTFVFWFSR